MNQPHLTRTTTALSRKWSPGLLSACGVLALSGFANGQTLNLLKTGAQQPLEDLNYLTPLADAQIVSEGGAVVTGDFDGDGTLETAFRDQGATAWRVNNRDVIEDGCPIFNPSLQVIVVGDFDGNGADDIAWRESGWAFWVLNSKETPLDFIYDAVWGLFGNGPNNTTAVGDFNMDGADEIAWRQTGFPGWAVNGKATALSVILDNLPEYDATDQLSAVGDFDGNGTEDLAWRRPGASGWNVNSVPVPLYFLNDTFGADFDPANVAHHVGDFDGNGTRDLAWRPAGGFDWIVDSLPTAFTIPGNFDSFDPATQFSAAGDFDGDGTDDLVWRDENGAGWYLEGQTVSDVFFPSLNHLYESSAPHHVGDFNGDGTDDVAWLPATAEDVWTVDSQGTNKGDIKGWEEPTGGTTIQLELVYADVDSDGEIDDYVLLVKGQNGDYNMLHKPLAIAYFLKTQDMTITEEFFDALSPEQQAVLIQDTQADPMLASSFDQPGFLFNQFEFNSNVDGINEMEVQMSYVGLGSNIPFTGGGLQTRFLDFSLSGGFGQNGVYGGDLSFSVATIDVSYGPISGGVSAGDVTAKAYISDKGFGFGAGATLVGASATLGNSDGSHVGAGVGFGIGAAVGGSWGDNDQYGAEVDIKLFSLAVYVSEDDANEVFDESKDWIEGAANDTATWTEDAWEDTSSYTADNIGAITNPVVEFTNKVGNGSVDFFSTFGGASGNLLEGILKAGNQAGVLGSIPGAGAVGGVIDAVGSSSAGQTVSSGVNAGISGGAKVGKSLGLW